ncbi:hypothetical protein F5Y06DRAFT_288627 [Hypoxylon sp. FL0890]|nr:hypothetical protein F5Y06DRAFT_288627 [Hypoxylon sp. FL0890]
MEQSNDIADDPSGAFDDSQAAAVFNRIYIRWKIALDLARSMRDLPTNVLDLDALLMRIPALPAYIPKDLKTIEGFSTWVNESTPDCYLRKRIDPTQTLYLRMPNYIKCSLSFETSFQVWRASANNGLALLFLAWAYILNASLAERQGLQLQHQPTSTPFSSQRRISLAYATKQEANWWRTILTPGMFCPKSGGIPPWTVMLKDVCSLEIAGVSNSASRSLKLPSALTAASYVARLCVAYNLGDQSSAAFAAALCLPYFMTLSLTTNAFKACLESVVWEPDIPCNLGGAVLRAANQVLGPILRAQNYELLAKDLSNTKAAPLWLGCATGGIVQSFFDLESHGSYFRNDNTVSRADIWRLRRDCSDAYPHGENYRQAPLHPWPPFGVIRFKDIDIELQSHLKCAHHWQYQSWTWLLPNPITDKGYVGFCQPQSPMPSPMVTSNNNPGKEELEAMSQISRHLTERIFFGCPYQVEKGFTNTVVPQCWYSHGSPESQSQGQPNFEAISKWIDGVISG